jgi:hypothetical protein
VEGKLKKSFVAALTALSLSNAALAGTPIVPQPFQIGEETTRFNKGIPVVSLELQKGAVQITPTAMDHGSLSFMIVVFNDGDQLANFGIENVTADIDGQTLTPFSKDQLESKAKNRAMWSQIGMAVLAGAAAAAASQATTKSTYHSRFRTPRGTYSYTSVYRDNSVGVLGATAATAGGVLAIRSIQQNLDDTLAQLDDEIIQTTTVDPGESYGGRIVLQKIKATQLPQNVTVSITWNGEVYKFGLRVPKKGDPAPMLKPATIASRAMRGTLTPAAAPTAGAAPAAQPTSRDQSNPSIPATASSKPIPIAIHGGYKVPAKTVSGYCLDVANDYRGTGSDSTPAVTDAMPRCVSGT